MTRAFPTRRSSDLKTPIIYRSSSQWFACMDRQPKSGRTLRETALEGIDNTEFYPAWGRARLHAMVANRPDCTLSRQRQWGVPMAFFIHKETGELPPRTVALMAIGTASCREGVCKHV